MCSEAGLTSESYGRLGVYKTSQDAYKTFARRYNTFTRRLQDVSKRLQDVKDVNKTLKRRGRNIDYYYDIRLA